MQLYLSSGTLKIELQPVLGSEKSIMDSGNVSVTIMDESPGSSSRSSSSPDIDSRLSPDRRRSEPLALSAGARGRPAAANAARERSRVQTLRHAFLELQRTLPSVPPDTKLSKLDVLILATTYIAHLTRTLQEEGMVDGEGTRHPDVLHSLKGDGYLHPVKKWPMRSRLYIGATGQFLNNSGQAENPDQGESSSASQT